jgi:thymidine kinase
MNGDIGGIVGPMGCGKTEELIRRVRRAELGRLKCVAVKPVIDNRYDEARICSHGGSSIPAAVVELDQKGLDDILTLGMAPGIRVVAIDELQFFPAGITGVCQRLRFAGRRVIWAGLDMDSFGHPFGPVPYMLAIGQVTKLTAVCMVCGADATHTFRKTNTTAQVVVGGLSDYEARCFRCWSRVGLAPMHTING